jgi:hypothetical protein
MSARLSLILGIIAVAAGIGAKSQNLAPTINTLSDFSALGGLVLIAAGIAGYVRRALR